MPDIEDDFDINDIRDNVVLRIIDKYEIDVSTKAWTVEFEEGIKDVKKTSVDGVEMPYLGIDSLIKSKQTMREIDQWDVKVLTEIKKKQTS